MTTQLGTAPNVGAVGLSLSTRNNGVWVSSVLPNSPAALAGLRANDQIVSVNGTSFLRAEDLQAYLTQANNTPVLISYLRNGPDERSRFERFQPTSPVYSRNFVSSKQARSN